MGVARVFSGNRTNMKLSIIIVNHNSQEHLKRCLASVEKNINSLEYEIIVVNNQPPLPSASLPARQGEGGVRVLKAKHIEAGENLGFGKACNLGAQQAMGELLWFLNLDTEIVSADINLLLNEFKSKQNLGISGPKLITEEDKVQEWSAGSEMNFGNLLKNNLGTSSSKKIWESEQKIPCAWVSGAALLIKKDLFQKLGGFDEKFFMYFEDIDLCRRANKLGYEIIYYPEFTVKHFGGKSFANKKAQKSYYYASQDCYFQKHFGQFTAFWVKVLRKIFA